MDEFDYNRPDTRARIEARRRNRQPARQAVMPGPGRTFAGWAGNGKIMSIPLLFSALLILVYITASPRFIVHDVRVEGADLLSPAAAIQLSESLGRSVWLVDTDRVASRLRTNAYVEQASAFLTLPDRLTIVVRERRPEVRWQSGAQRFLVDADGRVLGIDATAPLTGTLVIEDRSGRPVAANDRLDPEMLDLARELALRLPAELGQTPRTIAWAIDTGIVVELPAKTIIIGRSNDLDRKLTILGMLLHDGTAFTMLDLRPETPFYRNDPPGGAPSTASP